MAKTRVSIITAAFNSEATIRDTLVSVNAQSYPLIEHIIIDGASVDDTLKFVDVYGGRVLNVISESDGGIYDAFNKGVALAKGEILGILNSDDFYLSSDVIANVVHAFDSSDVDAVFADLVYVEKNNTAKIVRYWKSRPYRDGDFARGFSPAHPTLFLRRSVYEKVGNFNTNFRLASDFEFMLRVFHSYGIKSLHLPQIVVGMRTGGATGGSLSFIKKQNLEVLQALENHGVRVCKATYFGYKIADRLVQRLRAPFVRLPGSAS
jgi:glycosyltransferase involved in cell wall biosynthesis